MVSRRLREHGLQARTVQIKVRNQAFETYIRARTLTAATDLDIEIGREARTLFRENWRPDTKILLLGVHVSQFSKTGGQLDLLDGDKKLRWTDAMRAADRLRDRYGDDAVTLAGGMRGKFRERTHEALVDKARDPEPPS
jgi:DNA polymerase-4